MSEAKVGTVVEAKAPREAPGEDIGRKQTTVNGQSEAPRSVHRRPEQSATKPASGFQRTTSAIRTLLPLVQKVLPLLEGNFASVAVNQLAPAAGTPSGHSSHRGGDRQAAGGSRGTPRQE